MRLKAWKAGWRERLDRSEDVEAARPLSVVPPIRTPLLQRHGGRGCDAHLEAVPEARLAVIFSHVGVPVAEGGERRRSVPPAGAAPRCLASRSRRPRADDPAAGRYLRIRPLRTHRELRSVRRAKFSGYRGSDASWRARAGEAAR